MPGAGGSFSTGEVRSFDSPEGGRPLHDMRMRLFEHAVENISASIIITDASGAIVYVNPYFTRITGFSSAEVLGRNPRLFKSGRQSREYYHELWSTILSGRDWHGEFENHKKNGESYWEKAIISPLRDERGVITHFVAIKHDITDSKRDESNLAWLAALVENSNDICVIKDTSHRLLAANTAYARLLGYASPYELPGRSTMEIMRQDPSEEPLKSVLAAELAAQKLPPGGMLTREESFDLESDFPKIYFSRYFPIHDAGGRLVATACISSDISERKAVERDLIRAKEEAEAANRAKSAFLATMSHELRTPLNVINGVTSTLLEKELTPEHRQALQLVIEGGQSLLGIIEEILEYSGLQAGKIRLVNQPYSPASVVLQALQFTHPSSIKKGIALSYWIDPRTPATILGDTARLKQVLINLLHNAIKFTEKGRVHLALHVVDRQGSWSMRFSISDTGIGMDSATRNRIFQPFTQADASIKRRFGGTGLGLAISQNYVSLMGGRITVKSRVGRGSVFSFSIPCHGLPDSGPAFKDCARPAMQGKRVLLCSSRGYVNRLANAFLRTWGVSTVLVPPRLVPAVTTSSCAGIDAIVCDDPDSSSQEVASDPRTQSSDALRSRPDIRIGRSAANLSTGELPRRLDPLMSADDFAKALLSLWDSKTASSRANAPTSPIPRQQPKLGEILPLSILAADDIRTNREAIRLIAGHLGYSVKLVENGAEVLSLLPHGKYDVILLDMQMPVLDGLSTAREIRRRYPDPKSRPKMIAITANALAGDVELCLEAGMDAYLSKPIVPKQLADVLMKLFGHGNDTSLPKSDPGIRFAGNAQPWIDDEHLKAITQDADQTMANELVSQLFATFRKDYEQIRPRLQQASSSRDFDVLIEVVHGLKGGALMLGWTRMGHSTVIFLNALRTRTFSGWDSFPEEIDRLFQQSALAMELWISQRKSLPPERPTTASAISRTQETS